MAHPTGVQLQFLAWLTVDHRQCGRMGGEAQFQNRETTQSGVADEDALAPEKLADLGQPHPCLQSAANEISVLLAQAPAVSPGPASSRLKLCHQRGRQLFGESGGTLLLFNPHSPAAFTYRRTGF